MTPHDTVKQCCARLYESDFARLLLGDSFHPGGTRLTERMGRLLQLTPESRVLDVASGTGTSAHFLARTFDCEVVGVDYSAANIEKAAAQPESRVTFQHADAERLPFDDGSFDAIICECAFCTFPDKPAAAHEFARVLRPGGRAGLSDLTRSAELPAELNSLLAWIACLADAQPLESYAAWLTGAGLEVEATEPHDDALLDMAQQVRMKLLGAEVMAGLGKLDLPGADLSTAKELAQAAMTAVRQGKLGYAIVTARKSAGHD